MTRSKDFGYRHRIDFIEITLLRLFLHFNVHVISFGFLGSKWVKSVTENTRTVFVFVFVLEDEGQGNFWYLK